MAAVCIDEHIWYVISQMTKYYCSLSFIDQKIVTYRHVALLQTRSDDTAIRPWARGVHHAPPHIPTKLCFSEPSECPQ